MTVIFFFAPNSVTDYLLTSVLHIELCPSPDPLPSPVSKGFVCVFVCVCVHIFVSSMYVLWVLVGILKRALKRWATNERVMVCATQYP